MPEFVTSLDIEDYTILQNTDDYAFSQDSVFLANIAKLLPSDEVLDLGCGCGILATLALVKKHVKRAVGIEIQSDVADMARRSAQNNRLQDRLTIIDGDIKDIRKLVSAESFDKVLCNPPYFDDGNGCTKKSISRQENTATLCDFAGAASYSLKFGGDAWFVCKFNRIATLLSSLTQNKLEPKEITLVYPTASAQPDIIIVKARKGAKPGVISHSLIVKDDNGEYTDKYKELYI